MWMFTNFGAFSVSLRHADEVDDGDNRLLQVRSRRSQDLVELRERYLPNASKVIHLHGRDYEYRVYCTHEDWARATAALSFEIDYSNFKNSVKNRALHNAYMRIWGVIFDAFSQDRLTRRTTKRRRRAERELAQYAPRKNWWDDIDDPTDEQIFAQAEEMFPELNWK